MKLYQCIGTALLMKIHNCYILKQDKSSDIEQQPSFGDRKISNIQPQNRRRGTKPAGTSYNFDKV